MGKVAKTEGTALANVKDQNNLPAEMLEELLEDAGKGVSSSADDKIVPFIVLLQDMSHEVKKRDPEYVEGAEVGMLLNKATKQLYAADPAQAEATGLPLLYFQPCAFDRCIVEWVPRNDGGGFVARYPLNGTSEATMLALGGKQVPDPQDPNKKLWKTADGSHDLIDTRYHYGLVLGEDGTVSPAVLAFSSTGHQASREWMTMMDNFKLRTPDNRMVPAPSWSKKYRVGTKPKSNKKGDFFVMSIQDAGVIQDASVRALGKELHKAVTTGAVTAAQDAAPTSGAAADDDSGI